jgi:hypothetical protein
MSEGAPMDRCLEEHGRCTLRLRLKAGSFRILVALAALASAAMTLGAGHKWW